MNQQCEHPDKRKICIERYRLADKQYDRPSGSIPSNTQRNTRGSKFKPYSPPQARNEQINSISTRSGKAYNPPSNPNNAQPPIEFESDNEEPTPQTPKPIKETQETLVLKSYKPYLQRLRNEKMEAQYGKFLDVIRVVRISVPLVDVLA
nr:reverse transcriptase domain-containing protein [Tanacetum cinerariifolium]